MLGKGESEKSWPGFLKFMNVGFGTENFDFPRFIIVLSPTSVFLIASGGAELSSVAPWRAGAYDNQRPNVKTVTLLIDMMTVVTSRPSQRESFVSIQKTSKN